MFSKSGSYTVPSGVTELQVEAWGGGGGGGGYSGGGGGVSGDSGGGGGSFIASSAIDQTATSGGGGYTLTGASGSNGAVDFVLIPTTPPGSVPEPASFVLLATGAIGFGVMRRWRRRILAVEA